MEAIGSGVNFLTGCQLESGEFPTYVGHTAMLDGAQLYASPFISSFVLYAIAGLDRPELPPLRAKALAFMRGEQEPGGLWRNHSRDNPFHRQHRLPADLDDTATIAFCLKSHDIAFEDNRAQFARNRNRHGLYYTWIDPPFGNEIDALVNTNVLLYLGENQAEVISYIDQVIQNDATFSRWYPHRFYFFYMVARAFQQGVTDLSRSRQPIIERIRHYAREEGGLGNDLATAMALVTLLTFDPEYSGELITQGISQLLKRQQANGAWQRCVFFNGFDRCYGSEALTTAIALQALHQYTRWYG